MENGQKAALVIRLFYEEERQKAENSYRENVGRPNKSMPELAEIKVSRDTSNELAKKAGIGRSSMTYLIAVYKNRPDLFERVFNGELTINKAYTTMKAGRSATILGGMDRVLQIWRGRFRTTEKPVNLLAYLIVPNWH